MFEFVICEKIAKKRDSFTKGGAYWQNKCLFQSVQSIADVHSIAILRDKKDLD